MVRRSTGILFVVFVVLLLGVLFWQQTKQSEESKITPTAVQEYLFDFDAEITNLIIESPDGKVVEMARDKDGQWALLQPENEDVDISRAETTSTQLMVLRVLAKFDQEVPEKSAVGLDKPSYVITFTLNDGSNIVVHIGDATPTDSGFYVNVDGRGVFVVEKYGLQTILDLVESPPIMPTPMVLDTTPTP
jgi:hypothetical protein